MKSYISKGIAKASLVNLIPSEDHGDVFVTASEDKSRVIDKHAELIYSPNLLHGSSPIWARIRSVPVFLPGLWQ